MKKYLFIISWILSLIIAIIFTFENPNQIEVIKNYFNKDKAIYINPEQGEVQRQPGNSFIVQFSKVLSFSEKTSFIIYDEENLNFNVASIEVYTQDGYLLKNTNSKKINLPKTFTREKNGGIKNIFVHDGKKFALISSKNNECFYVSIVSLNNAKELLKTKCLPEKYIDFNGVGSSSIHHENKIYISIGAPEQRSSKIAQLAQDDNSMFGKIIEIDKNDLDQALLKNDSNLNVKIFTKGHRNPQGLTRIEDHFFSVEHGPRGGDELNKIIKNKNYGWPKVSYGTKYFYDTEERIYEVNHEKNQFMEPIFALVPSVGISAVNKCPLILKNYYKKPCLLALSLYGNSLRPGKSLIIYLLNEQMNQVHSVEKIFLRDYLKLRHFVTNSKNELYEDKEGSIYISADNLGIYKISFVDFTN